MVTNSNTPSRPRTFDLSIAPADRRTGHLLFLAELPVTSTTGIRHLPVAGDAHVLVDVALPGLYPVSIEIHHEQLLIDPGGDPDRIQFRPVTFHLAAGVVSYISHGGFEFDGSDQGAFPGLDCTHDRHGQLLAIRVARAGFNTTRT